MAKSADSRKVGFHNHDPLAMVLVLKCQRGIAVPTGFKLYTNILFKPTKESLDALRRARVSNDHMQIVVIDTFSGTLHTNKPHKILDLTIVPGDSCVSFVTKEW